MGVEGTREQGSMEDKGGGHPIREEYDAEWAGMWKERLAGLLEEN